MDFAFMIPFLRKELHPPYVLVWLIWVFHWWSLTWYQSPWFRANCFYFPFKQTNQVTYLVKDKDQSITTLKLLIAAAIAKKNKSPRSLLPLQRGTFALIVSMTKVGTYFVNTKNTEIYILGSLPPITLFNTWLIHIIFLLPHLTYMPCKSSSHVNVGIIKGPE